jgi:DNA-binding CsgD family transcriptional regulator
MSSLIWEAPPFSDPGQGVEARTSAREAALAAAAIDAVLLPAAVLSPGGVSLHANAALDRLLDEGEYGAVLRLPPEHLTATAEWPAYTGWAHLPASDGGWREALVLSVRLVGAAGLLLCLVLDVRPGREPAGEGPPAQARLDRLTPRETEVLERLLGGESNKTMARAMGISPRTVEVHRSRVLQKLGVQNLAQALALVAAAGPPPQLSATETPRRRNAGAGARPRQVR